MKCAHCKGHHKTVSEVKNCSQGSHTQCRHGLDSGTCTCGWQRGIRGLGHMRPIVARTTSWCWICESTIEPGERIIIHWKVRTWVHAPCLPEASYRQEDPFDWMNVPERPPYEGRWDPLARLLTAADELIPDAIREERTSTVPMLRQIEVDMGEPLALDLISETFDHEPWEWVWETPVGWERAWVQLGLVPSRFLNEKELKES